MPVIYRTASISMLILDIDNLTGYYFSMSYCFACGIEFPENIQVYRTTECPGCGRDVKVCLNCKFYSPGSNYDCREHISEPVRDKEKANFCDNFKLGDRKSEGGKDKKATEARSAFNDLFGNE